MNKTSKTKNIKYKIGIVGTGFIARGLMHILNNYPNLETASVLTRRNADSITDLPVDKSIITNDIDTLISRSELVVECSGDVIYGTGVLDRVLDNNLPVVTMNSELQIVSGTMLARKGKFVEAEGDQPGSLAALDKEVKEMGFTPLVYGNMKRFLNLNPTPQDMDYWAKKQGISLAQVTSFTDGTKVQIEQALVANGLGATIVCRNLSGVPCRAVEDGALRLAEIAESMGNGPISDYIMHATGPAGVFIVATHKPEQKPYLEYLKLGSGPHYVLIKPYHLCHAEIPKTIMRILEGTNGYNFNNGQNPTIQVVSVTKRDIAKGEKLERALGGFTIRGEAVKIKDYPNAVPVGLLQDATFIKPIAEGRIVNFDDVELPTSKALDYWKQTLAEVLEKNGTQK